MSLRIAALKAGFSIVIMAMCRTAAEAGVYDTWGVSSQDAAEYGKAAASIGSCSAAHSADPDPMHPTDNPQSLLHLASLYGECGDILKRQHSSAAILRTNGLFLSFKCSALAASTGSAVTSSACTSRSEAPAGS